MKYNRHTRGFGVFLVSLGISILLSFILPLCFVVFVESVLLIVIGCFILKNNCR